MDRTNRPSPLISATKFKKGTRKRGNDGNMWEIIITSNGVRRWKKITKSSRKTSRRKTSRRKTSRRKTSRRKTSRRKTSRRKISRRKTSRRKISQKSSRKEDFSSNCYNIKNEKKCMQSSDETNKPCYWSILGNSNKCIIHGYYGFQGQGKSDATHYPNQKDMIVFYQNNISQLLNLAKQDGDKELEKKLENLKKKVSRM